MLRFGVKGEQEGNVFLFFFFLRANQFHSLRYVPPKIKNTFLHTNVFFFMVRVLATASLGQTS